MSSLLPTNTGGAASSWSISPSPPSGILFNTTSGRISGTATTSLAGTTFTITATNSTGSDTFVITISVTGALASPAISYTSSSLNLTVGSTMTSLSPTNAGGAASSWSVSPSLPSGLSLDTSTGVLSGTPTAISSLATYVVTATNATGSDNFSIDIAVAAASTTTSSTTTTTAAPQSSPPVQSTTTTTSIATVTNTTTSTIAVTTTTQPRRRPPNAPVRSTTTTVRPTTRTTTSTIQQRPVSTSTTVVRPITTVRPIVVTTTTTTISKPLPLSTTSTVTRQAQTTTTTVKQSTTTALTNQELLTKISTDENNVFNLAYPVYVNGELPNPRAGQPIAIQTGPAEPVNVLVINDQVLQMATIGTSLRINVLDDEGNVLPVGANGAIVVNRNNTFVVSGSGWSPGTEMVAWIFSTPQKIGTIPVPDDGEYSTEMNLPVALDIGEHTIQVNGITSDGSVRSLSVEVLYLGDTETSQRDESDIRFWQRLNFWILVFCALVAMVSSWWLIFNRRRRRSE